MLEKLILSITLTLSLYLSLEFQLFPKSSTISVGYLPANPEQIVH